MRVPSGPVLRIAAIAVVALVALVTAPLALLIGRGAATDVPPPGSGIPTTYMPIYAVAERTYHVNRWLLASIHFQEARFSTLRAPSLVGDAVAKGWNQCGAAGPVQMGIVGVAPYGATTAGGCSAGPTWVAHRTAFRRAARWRPADYPLRRDKLPGCFAIPSSHGCVYDDFDAILGAAHKLRRDGADLDLDSPGTRATVCAYIGACAAADTYYAVIPRAKEWEAMAEAGQPLGLQEGVGPSGLIWPVVGPVVSGYGMRWGGCTRGSTSPRRPARRFSRPPTVRWCCAGGSGLRAAHLSAPCRRPGDLLRAPVASARATSRARPPRTANRADRLHRALFRATSALRGASAGTWSAHERDVDPLEVLPTT